MECSAEQLVQNIHASATRVVAAVSGGGSRAIADLLEVPGASRTLLEAVVPYCEKSLIAWLGGRPDQSCSPQTTRAMAMTAFRRALAYDEPEALPAGVACTAGLATDRPKLGPHRAHVAVQTAACTATWSLELLKDRRTRADEERLVAKLILNAVAATCGLEDRLALELLEGEQVEHRETVAPQPWRNLLLGKADYISQGGTAENKGTGSEPPDRNARQTAPGEAPVPIFSARTIFPGAFNPLHAGHRRMIQLAGDMLHMPVAVEISIVNVEKPPLDYFEIERRVRQFPPEQTIWLSRAATFEEKSRLFPGATFLVGVDTLRRIAAPAFYGNDAAACQAALQRIAGRGCRFLVFGRRWGAGFIRLSDLDLPDALRIICREVPADTFREDVSSTELRKAGAW